MILRWVGGWVAGTDEPVAVIDSFRVLDGCAVRLDLHERRFADAVARLGVPLRGFLPAVRAALPREGDWFPRLEASADGDLQLRLRPSPAIGTRVTLWPASSVVQRDPHTKGADLPALEEARARAQANGADDALLLDATGRVLEGATTSLVWWRGNVPCTVATRATLDSVTRRVVAGLVGPLTRVDARLDDLAGCEVWALNALHGIRPVTGIVGGPKVGDPTRATAWRERYEALRTPLD